MRCRAPGRSIDKLTGDVCSRGAFYSAALIATR